jgi:hypothetical protein
MLIGSARRRLLAAVVVATTLVTVTLLSISSASAQVVTICDNSGNCWTKVFTPGQAGFPGMPGGGGSSGPRMCLVPANEATTVQPPGLRVPCYSTDFGYLDTRGCYWRVASPQPDEDDEAWRGNYPNGRIWYMTCPWAAWGGGNSGLVWRDSDPPQAGAMPTAAELAAMAIAELNMPRPVIGIVPEAGGTGLVGLPVWLWTQREPTDTWVSDTRTAAVPGLAVVVTSEPRKIAWNMGDGSEARDCLKPGITYLDRYGLSVPGDACVYRYQKPGTYTITATTTFWVQWRTTLGPPEGEGFPYPLTAVTSVTITINELQVVTG